MDLLWKKWNVSQNKKLQYQFTYQPLVFVSLAANKGSFVPTTQVPSHLYVSSVDSNGPAGQAGIKVGDYVLKV